MFEKEKYYKYINTINTMNTITYIILVIIAFIISIVTNISSLIITIPLGLLIANIYTFNNKIKIQEMKWKMDIYNKIITNKESL